MVLLRSTCDIHDAILRPTPSIFDIHYTHDNEYCILSFMAILLDWAFVVIYQPSIFTRMKYLLRILVSQQKILLKSCTIKHRSEMNNAAAAQTIGRLFYCCIFREGDANTTAWWNVVVMYHTFV